jgi:2-methylisocitrate lyase-like PEP mutase family enzyme
MAAIRPSIAEKRHRFQRLHQSGCFVIPNPWDVGSALYLQSLGFQALATTSSGFAWTQGRPDGGITREMALAHFEALVEASDLPINADFEGGFAPEPAAVAENVSLAVRTGIAGISIEDSTGDDAHPLHDLPTAVARIRAARGAIDRAGGDVLLVGRAECYLVGRAQLPETIERLRAYAQAGADCLYAPGLRSLEDMAAIASALAPKPVNVLIHWAGAPTVSDIAALGVRRVSLGGALARTAWGAFMRAAQLLAVQGSFDGLLNAADGGALDTMFGNLPRH